MDYKEISRSNYREFKLMPSSMGKEVTSVLHALELVDGLASPIKEEIFVRELFSSLNLDRLSSNYAKAA